MKRRKAGLALGLFLIPAMLAAGGASASTGSGTGSGTVSGNGRADAAAARLSSSMADIPRQAYSGASNARPILVAQADDTRLQQLEEEVRQLTGKVEELNFQVLKMQDQMQKMQDDNEFRFQQLEKGSGATAGSSKKSELSPPAAPRVATTSGQQAPAPAQPTPPQVAQPARPAAEDGQGLGTPPRALGTISLDANGNVINSSVNPDAPAAAPAPAAGSLQRAPSVAGSPSGGSGSNAGARVAALPQTDNPNVLYKQAYDLLLSGDYASAEAGFREHIKRYPADPQTADARYWLGESLFGQQRYSEAAQVFLDTHRDYPKARTAAEDLLKLGMSLSKLGNRAVACATLKEVGVEYPNAPAAVQDKVAAERASSGC